MTNDEVKLEAERLVELWKPLLGLRDWAIMVEVPSSGLSSIAQIAESEVYRKAHLEIRNPDLHSPESWGSSDIEESVVHELLHPMFNMVKAGKLNSYRKNCFERSIDQLARTLVALRRAGSEA